MGDETLDVEKMNLKVLDLRGQVEALEFTCVTIIGLLDVVVRDCQSQLKIAHFYQSKIAHFWCGVVPPDSVSR